MRELCVSIINYRTADLTIQCVQSVLADLGGTDGEIVIVDNASGDGSEERLTSWIATLPAGPPVRLVRSPRNSGFSGGHNQGMAAVEARYYLVLNSDAILRPGFCAAILSAAEAHPEAGFIAPRLEDEDGTAQHSSFRFPNPMSELIRGANSGPVTRLFERYDVPLDIAPADDEIEWASFACILLNRNMVEEIGPMDEGYFLYFEDAEYCLRARRMGWRLRRAPDAVAVHFRGGSGPVKSLAKARKRLPAYYYRSRSRFFCQAHGRVGLLAANVLWLLGRCVAGLRWIAGRRPGNFRQAELRDIWINFFHPLRPDRTPWTEPHDHA